MISVSAYYIYFTISFFLLLVVYGTATSGSLIHPPNSKVVSDNISPLCCYILCINKYVQYEQISVCYAFFLQLCPGKSSYPGNFPYPVKASINKSAYLFKINNS